LLSKKSSRLGFGLYIGSGFQVMFDHEPVNRKSNPIPSMANAINNA